MSYHSLFGAYVVPRSASDPLSYRNPDSLRTDGSSRNGWFQAQCGLLLDTYGGHESLRFLSAQSSSIQQSDGTTFTLIDGNALCDAHEQLEALISCCRDDIDLLTERLGLRHDGYTTEDVRAALAATLERAAVPEHQPDGEDGASPRFLFSALAAVIAILRYARERDLMVVFFNWLPQR